MDIKIEKDSQYSNKVKALDIHGKYPYKIYLEITGNSTMGKHLVIVSNKEITKGNGIEHVLVKINNKVRKKDNINIIRPNEVSDGLYIKYKVREVSILDIGELEILVFKAL